MRSKAVYIAARYGRRLELRALASAIRAHGVEVTSQWLDGAEEAGQGAAAAAQMDLDDVDRADTLVFIGEPHGSANRGGGRWFEMGYAHAKGKRIIVVLAPLIGHHVAALGSTPDGHESVFTFLPNMELVDSVEAAMRALL